VINKTKKQNVITIGGATQDIIIQYADIQSMHLHTHANTQTFTLLGAGDKIEIKALHYSTGGGATNSAVSFKRLDFEATACFTIGDDPTGEYILHELLQENITTLHTIAQHEQTGTSVIIPSCEGDRTIFAYRGANGHMQKEHIPYTHLENADVVYITSLSGDSAKLLPLITQHAKKHEVLVAHNPGQSQLMAGANILRNSLPAIDILILNAHEAKQLMMSLVDTSDKVKKTSPHQPAPDKAFSEVGSPQLPSLISSLLTIEDICFNIHHFFTTVLNYGPRIVVVTNGAEGVYVADKQTIYFHPSIPAPIACTTLGAGDAFGSCFVACIAHDDLIEQALVNGIINASSIIGNIDAKKGLLALDELKKRADLVGLKGVQRFALTLPIKKSLP